MAFRALQEEEKKKKFVAKLVAACVVVCILTALTVFSAIVPPESWEYYFSLPKIAARADGELRIHYLDVGQGDCTLVELPDGKVMLVDGGKDSTLVKRRIMRYLNALEIQTIDYLVVTHTDGDHCGSLDEVFRFKKVLNAYMPTSFDVEDTQYAEVYDLAVKEDCNLIAPSREVELSTDLYTLSFLYPYAESLEEASASSSGNATSAVIWLDYFGTSALFCGDAPEAVEQKLMREDKLGFFKARGVELSSTELLKVAHHGSYASSCEEFLEYIHAETAFVSVGENSYGHPTETVLARLAERNIALYRTDVHGNVVVTLFTDGSYKVNAVQE